VTPAAAVIGSVSMILGGAINYIVEAKFAPITVGVENNATGRRRFKIDHCLLMQND